MNIKDFKQGDLIIRNRPVEIEGGFGKHKDYSYSDGPITFIGVEDDIIILLNSLGIITLNAYRGWDEGWVHYPLSLLEKAKSLIKKKAHE